MTYAHFRERGSIDILACHRQANGSLVIEIESELVSIEATLRKLDEKVRLAGPIARERFRLQPTAVGRLLVLPATSTERCRVARHARVLDAALPLRQDALRAWIRRPAGPVGGLLFVADSTTRDAMNGGATSSRVRRTRPTA